MRENSSCSVVRHEGYSAHTSKELSIILGRGSADDKKGSCKSARLLARSSFASCAAACLAQPFCEAVTWLGSKHRNSQLRFGCFGRTAGLPATFLNETEAFGPSDDADATMTVVSGIVRCAPCELQQRLDAICASLFSPASGCHDAVARNALSWESRARAEDFRWGCYPPPAADAPLSLGCVDGRGLMAACPRPSGGQCCRGRCPMWGREELHDMHRTGCAMPACLSTPGSAAPLLLRAEQHDAADTADHPASVPAHSSSTPPPAPPPPPSPPPLPPLPTWEPRGGRRGVEARVARLFASGYLNCTVAGDELHGKCLDATHRSEPFEWMRYMWGGSGSGAARRGEPAAEQAAEDEPSGDGGGGGGGGGERLSTRAQLTWWAARPEHATDDWFDPYAFVQGVMRLGGREQQTVRFVGDSTARQQAVSLCCLLHAGAVLGAPYTWRLDKNLPYSSYRCAVLLEGSTGGRHPKGPLLSVMYSRFNRADALGDDRPSELTPRLNYDQWGKPGLLPAIMARPTVLVFNLGAWEFEDGCHQPGLHSLHDSLCDAQGVAWRHHILSGYARKLGLVAAALESSYAPGEARDRSLVVLRTASPRDFEGGRVFIGRCDRREPISADELQRAEAAPPRGQMRFAVMSKNAMLLAMAAQRLPWVSVLDAYGIARQRADAHTGATRPLPGQKPKSADCLHYCLPGVPDVYNGRLMTLLRARLASGDGNATAATATADAGGGTAEPAAQLLARWNFRHLDAPFVEGAPPALALNVHPGHGPAVELECAPTVVPRGYRGPMLGFCSDRRDDQERFYSPGTMNATAETLAARRRRRQQSALTTARGWRNMTS